MNKSILLLIVIGLAAAGWLNRETISGWIAQRSAGTTETEEATPSPEPGKPAERARPPATPNPALEAVAQAKRTYPALAKAGSAFNLRFVALYNEARAGRPDLLAQADWPLQLAERTAKELGGGALPRAGMVGVTGWTENYAEAMENAKMENKKLLLDFTGSDWCGYSQKLDKEVLSTPTFQAWASENVVLVLVDFPRSHPQSARIKEQNAALKNRYPFDGYPTIVILDSSGRELGRQSGYNPGSGPNAYLAALEGTMRR